MVPPGNAEPLLCRYIKLCLKVVYAAGAMVTLCLCSLLFSIFDVVGSPLILLLAGTNCVGLLAILLVPLVPIYQQLEGQKAALNRRIGILKQQKFYDGVSALESDHSSATEISDEQTSFTQISEELKALDLMSKTVDSVFTMPHGYVVVKTVASTVVVTAAPYLASSVLAAMKTEG